MDLSNWRRHVLLYWLGTPDQHRQTNRLYRQMRIGAAARELARMTGARITSPGYGLVPHRVWSDRFKNRVLPVGAHLWYKAQDALWWLGKISKSPNIRLLRTPSSCASSTTRGRSKSTSPRSSTLPPWTPSADRGASSFTVVVRFGADFCVIDVDESRGVETATA